MVVPTLQHTIFIDQIIFMYLAAALTNPDWVLSVVFGRIRRPGLYGNQQQSGHGH
jgi:hypothetical protein